MRTLILMQGCPGSGKSTVAGAIYDNWFYSDETPVTLSTDEYWYQRHGENGVYLFDADLLPEAHQWTQDRCRGNMKQGYGPIIIDNTNIKKEAAQPYLDMAAEFGYQVQVVRVTCPIEVAIERNAQRPVDRQVPEGVIRRMASDMEDLV